MGARDADYDNPPYKKGDLVSINSMCVKVGSLFIHNDTLGVDTWGVKAHTADFVWVSNWGDGIKEASAVDQLAYLAAEAQWEAEADAQSR